MIRSGFFRRLTNTAAEMRTQHGLVRAFTLLTLRGLARLSGGTVLACMHKHVEPGKPCHARLLTRAEIECASANPALDLPADFVVSTIQSAQCYGVVIDGHVRCYAWTAAGPVRAVPGTVVNMPADSAYVFKSFTHPAFRGRGLLRDCLTALERGALRAGRTEMSALVEIHNRSSLRGFNNSGFTRCGLVFVLRRPWLIRKFACSCAAPCTWSRDIQASASAFRSSTEVFARRG